MALIVPNSRIEFMTGIPFDPSYENTMYFTGLAEQNTYFASKISHVVENSSYQRVSSGYIKVGWVVDTLGGSVINQLYNANYMRFKNTNFENKWFYAFVDKVEYINNNTVGVYYHLDVLQTWHFEYSFNECFIERQHTVTDTLGYNTIPEDFELGDYMISSPTEIDYHPAVVVVTTGDINGDFVGGRIIDGKSSMGDMFSGCQYYVFDIIDDPTALTHLNNLLASFYTNRSTLNNVVAVYMQPIPLDQKPVLTHHHYINKINGQYALGNYVVRNKKLMTYPYNFIYVSNYQGNHTDLRYEYFANPEDCLIKAWWSTGPNCAIVLYPNEYKGVGDNFDEMMQVTGFPMCSWMNDAYKAWLAQNAGTLLASGAVSTANVILGATRAVEGDPTAGQQLFSGLASVERIIGQVLDHYVMPPQSNGNINANTQYQLGKLNFLVCTKYIREEYASLIDDFFDMYGYAMHRRGIPNRNARPCYTYVKTVDCSVDGNVPVSDLKLIEGIFNKGVRFWRTNATFGVYNPNVNDNTPVSV